MLFNLHRVAAAGHVYVVVVEGIWSVLRLHAAGILAVALLGAAASDQHGPFLRAAGIRYTIVLLDGDEAGRAATPGVVHALSGHLYVRHIELPPGIKPDSMDEADLDALRPAGQRRIP